MVEKLLGKGHSLASVGNWADDIRGERPATYNWHFADIPVADNDYQPQRDCKPDPGKGDCVVAELIRLASELRNLSGTAQIEALKYAVHFVGDVHQPRHGVLEQRGGNGVDVDRENSAVDTPRFMLALDRRGYDLVEGGLHARTAEARAPEAPKARHRGVRNY